MKKMGIVAIAGTLILVVSLASLGWFLQRSSTGREGTVEPMLTSDPPEGGQATPRIRPVETVPSSSEGGGQQRLSEGEAREPGVADQNTPEEDLLAQAVEAMVQVREEDKHNPDAGWLRPETEQNLAAIVAAHPETEVALTAKLLLVSVYLAQGSPYRDPNRAEAILADIQEQSPGHWQAQVARGTEGALLYVRGHYGLAAKYLEVALYDLVALDRQPPRQYLLYKKAVLQGASHKDLKWEVMTALIEAYWRGESMVRAKESISRLLDQYPDYPRASWARSILAKIEAGERPSSVGAHEKSAAEAQAEIRRIDEH